MKSSCRTITAPHAFAAPEPITAPQAITEVTGATITDAMIRKLLSDARIQRLAELCVACAKALRHPKTIRTDADAAMRREARRECADEINRLAKDWLLHGPRLPKAFARHAEYARLLGAHLEHGGRTDR